ncbi:MAG: phosphate/phosphite/phosphonate ABC transporter substrate-binding protein [Marinobacter sp.]
MNPSSLLPLLALTLLSNWLVAAETPERETCGIDRLKFTMIPKTDFDQQASEYHPLLELLEEGLGVPVDLVRASSYQSVIDAIVAGSVDLAVMGPASYILAHRDDPGIEAFASLITAKGELTPEGSFYYSVLLVPTAGDVERIEDLRSARVLLTDPSSTSGALIPKYAFAVELKESFSDFFGAEIYAGSHDKALLSLADNQAEAAFVSSARADELFRRGLIRKNAFKVLWRSPALHYDPFVFRSGICPTLRETVIELLKTPSVSLKAYLHGQQAVGVNRVSHSDYEAIDSILPN